MFATFLVGAWMTVMPATAYATPATPHPIRPMVIWGKRPWPPSYRRARFDGYHNGRGKEYAKEKKNDDTESERRKDKNKELE